MEIDLIYGEDVTLETIAMLYAAGYTFLIEYGKITKVMQ